MVMCQSTKNKLIGAAAVTTLALAGGGYYYWKFKRRPSSRGGRFPFGRSFTRPISRSDDKCTVSFCDKPTDVMSYSSYRGRQFGMNNRYYGDLGRTYKGIRDVSPSLTKPPICGKGASCSCRVTSCNHNKCNCGNWNNLSAHERGQCAVPIKTASPPCKCSTISTSRKATTRNLSVTSRNSHFSDKSLTNNVSMASEISDKSTYKSTYKNPSFHTKSSIQKGTLKSNFLKTTPRKSETLKFKK